MFKPIVDNRSVTKVNANINSNQVHDRAANAECNKAMKLINDGKCDDALQILDQLVVRYPHPYAHFMKGMLYAQHLDAAKQNPHLAFESMNFAAEKGIPEAMNAVGVMYANGLGVERNPTLAFEWLEKANAGGSHIAKYNLGLAYWDGLGCQQSKTKAFQLFEEAANDGVEVAHAEMFGVFKGIGVAESTPLCGDCIGAKDGDKYAAKAQELSKKCQTLRDARAQFVYGLMLATVHANFTVAKPVFNNLTKANFFYDGHSRTEKIRKEAQIKLDEIGKSGDAKLTASTGVSRMYWANENLHLNKA